MKLPADPATVVIFSILFSPALFLVGVLAAKRAQPVEATLVCGLYLVGVFFLGGRTVELRPGELVQTVLLVPRRTDLRRMGEARFTADPAPVLELWRAGAEERAFAMYLKAYSLAGVAALLAHLRACSPGIALDGFEAFERVPEPERIARENARTLNLLRAVVAVALGFVAAAWVRAR